MPPSSQTTTPSSKPKTKQLRLSAPSTSAITKPHWTRTTYFQARQAKLVAQAPSAQSTLLARCTIYFTGIKSHSQRRLETLVWRHGGTVQKVCLRTVVTHVIADNLAQSKIDKELSLNIGKRWNGSIVTPQWLVQSIQSNTILPTWDFQIIKGPSDVKDVASFFQKSKTNNQSTCSNKLFDKPLKLTTFSKPSSKKSHFKSSLSRKE